MSTAFCVCGPYHGTRVPADDSQDRLTLHGPHGPALYVLHHRLSPVSALYAFEGSTESEVATAVFELAKGVR